MCKLTTYKIVYVDQPTDMGTIKLSVKVHQFISVFTLHSNVNLRYEC